MSEWLALRGGEGQVRSERGGMLFGIGWAECVVSGVEDRVLATVLGYVGW